MTEKSLWKAFLCVMVGSNVNQHRNICKQDMTTKDKKQLQSFSHLPKINILPKSCKIFIQIFFPWQCCVKSLKLHQYLRTWQLPVTQKSIFLFSENGRWYFSLFQNCGTFQENEKLFTHFFFQISEKAWNFQWEKATQISTKFPSLQLLSVFMPWLSDYT